MQHIVYVDTKDTNTITQLSDLLINNSYSRQPQQWSFDLKTFRSAQPSSANQPEKLTGRAQYFLHFLNFNNQQELLINYKSVVPVDPVTDSAGQTHKTTQNAIKLSVPENFDLLQQNGCVFHQNLNLDNDIVFNKILNSNRKWQQRQYVSGRNGHIYLQQQEKTTVKVINVYTSSNELKGCIMQIDTDSASKINSILGFLNTFVEAELPKTSKFQLLVEQENDQSTVENSNFDIIRSYIKFLDI